MMTSTNIVMLALAPLLAYRVYKRVHRLTVRQPSRLWRHWCSVMLFPLVLVALAAAVIKFPSTLAALAAGTVVGGLLGFVALKRTGFERIGSAYFYTPYAPIGIVVAMLFIARLMYRGYEMATLGVQKMPDLGSNPLTLSIIGVMAGYYLVYGAGLLRWRSAERVLEEKK